MMFKLLPTDIAILEFLVKYRAARANELAVIGGMNVKYATDRLRVLYKKGYLTRARVAYGDKYVYAASKAAHTLLGIDTHPYELTNLNALHEANVAAIAILLMSIHGLGVDDIQTEREQKSGVSIRANKHYPDLVIPSKDMCIEYEHTAKDTKRLIKKVEENRDFKFQLWVIDTGQIGLERRIRSVQPAATKYGTPSKVDVVTIDNLAGIAARRAEMRKNAASAGH